MSGKKSWEVANVLDQTEKIQKEIFNEYDKEIEKNTSKINLANDKLDEQKDNVNKFILKGNIDKSLNDEFNQLKDKLNGVKDNIESIGEVAVFELERQQKRIKKRLKEENEKAEKIRDKIKNTAHYVTEEYNQAQKIKKNLNEIRKEYSELKNQSYNLINQLSKNITIIASKINELKEIQTQFEDLKKKSTKIKEIRNKANLLKEEIIKEFKNIEKEKVVKFERIQYETLTSEINTFLNSSSENVIKNYPIISGKITTLKIDYSDKYNDFIAQQNSTQEFFDNIKNRGLEVKMILLENIVEDIDEKITPFEYYDHYKNSNTFDSFKDMLEKANSMFKKENFEEAIKILEDTNKFYEDISNKADKIRENITSSAELSFKIRDIMLSDEVNFRYAHLDLIDGNPINGFKLACQNGDTINFEEIRFDEKGDLIINLDHIENSVGTCGIRWNDMKKVFNQHGIPLVDVKKNGHSVIVPEKETTTKIDENQKEFQNG